jgi:hypothetical protein
LKEGRKEDKTVKDDMTVKGERKNGIKTRPRRKDGK